MSEEERAAVVDSIADEMTELFHEYTRGEIGFEELSFEMFDTLQTLHALAHGNVSIEYGDGDEHDDLPGDAPGSPKTGPSNGRKRRDTRGN
jgi:hypothetical protein